MGFIQNFHCSLISIKFGVDMYSVINGHIFDNTGDVQSPAYAPNRQIGRGGTVDELVPARSENRSWSHFANTRRAY